MRPVGVGRADLASELRFSDGRDGVELLRAVSYVDLPWLKVGTEGGKRDSLETVSWRTVNGRSVVMRMYDKGRETGLAAPGEWIRFERQRRRRNAGADSMLGTCLGRLMAAGSGESSPSSNADDDTAQRSDSKRNP